MIMSLQHLSAFYLKNKWIGSKKKFNSKKTIENIKFSKLPDRGNLNSN
jgi:hypothetical protein